MVKLLCPTPRSFKVSWPTYNASRDCSQVCVVVGTRLRKRSWMPGFLSDLKGSFSRSKSLASMGQKTPSHAMLDEMKVMKRARPAVRKIAQDAAVELRCCRNHVKGKCLTLTTRCAMMWILLLDHGYGSSNMVFMQVGHPRSSAPRQAPLPGRACCGMHGAKPSSRVRPSAKALRLWQLGGKECHVIRAGEVFTGKAWVQPSCEVLCHFEPRFAPRPPFAAARILFLFLLCFFCLFCCCAGVASSDLGGAVASRGVARAS